MAESKFFGRYYLLTLDDDTFEVEAGKPAMDIKFDVTYARGQTAREGTISILGLSRERMQKYLDLAAKTRGKALSELVHVRLEAGYFSDAGTLEILNGFAWYGTVTSPPEMWLTLKVSEYNPNAGRRTDIMPYNQTGNLKEVVEQLMDMWTIIEGVNISVEDKTQDQLLSADKAPQVTLSIPAQVTLGETIHYLNMQASDDIWFILRSRSGDSKDRQLLAIDKQTFKCTPAEDAEVNGDNGLLSVTGIDAVNGCVTTFLDGTIDDEFSHLNLQSALNPQANGRYYIVKKQYIGHFLGQEWYTRYFCSGKEGDAP